jgi:hypothetical protein
MEQHQKFLEFNGKTIVFLSKEGIYWIPLKPICEALNIEYTRSFKNVKNDPILGSELAIQPMQVSKNGKTQVRNVTCIPEQFIYGWIFSLRSESKELTEYKKTCYELLFNHFHGAITGRKELLIERLDIDTQIHQLKEELKEQDSQYLKLHELQQKRKRLSGELNSIDTKIINQTEISFN